MAGSVPSMTESTPEAGLTVVPANEASWENLRAIFGTRGEPAACQCQYFKMSNSQWREVPVTERAERFRGQTGCDDPQNRTTTGIVGYLDDEPVGWCAVEPRTAYPRLANARVPWTGRDEDKSDDSVWAVTCFVVRKGFRKRGVSYELALASVDFARDRGARALEAYPIVTEPGKEYIWGELYVGAHSVFADAGFTEVSRPTARRAVMRLDF